MAESSDDDLKFLRRGTVLHALGLVAGNVSPVLAILLARTFSPEDFGLYVSLQLLVLTLTRIAVLGLDRGLCWYLAIHRDEPARGEQALAAATWVTTGLCLVIIGAVGLAWAGDLLAWIPGSEDLDGAFTFACFLGLLPWTLLHLHAGAFEGLKRPEYRIFVSQGFVMSLAPASALLFVWLFPALGRWSMPLGLFLANTTGAAIVIWAAKRRMPALRYLPLRGLDRGLLAYSVPMGLSSFLAGLLQRIDLWMLVTFMGAAPAAVYAVMTMLSNGVRTVRQSYDQLLVPLVGGMPEGDRDRLAQVFSYAVHIVSSIQLPIAVAVLVFPEEILLIAGKDYVIAPEALAILLTGSLVQGFLGLTSPVLAGRGRSGALLVMTVVSLALNIALNAWFIPRLGITGAALATTISVAVISVASLVMQVVETRSWLFQRHLAINFVMIVAFVASEVLFQEELLAWPLWKRLVVFVVGSAVVGVHAWVKRSRRS